MVKPSTSLILIQPPPGTAYDPARWQRRESDGIPIYWRTDAADWFVPDPAADTMLRNLAKDPGLAADPAVARLLARLPDRSPRPYRGRAAELRLERLAELWFHLTNRCNLACDHCLFASSPKERAGLALDRIIDLADQAHGLGCRVFALTGGEPLVHPDIGAVIDHLLAFGDIQVVILTNGLVLKNILGTKVADRSRLHLQVSIDGPQPSHDALRGPGAFRNLAASLAWLRQVDWPFTLSMAVTAANVADMAEVVGLAATLGAANVHFMWYFIRGRARREQAAPVDLIFANWIRAVERAEACKVTIDNLAAMRTQVFAPAGTIHDGTTAGWQSLAVGPDDRLYPSAALAGVAELATDLDAGLETAWRRSPVLEKIRRATIADGNDPLRFVLGGGDMDHSFVHKGTFTGDDPYLPLYEKMALWLIAREAGGQSAAPLPGLCLQMGEVLESCGAHGRVALAHANCLLATAGADSLTVVKDYYRAAAGDRNEEILNPVGYDSALIDHIPPAYRFRGYGCGSPVLDAGIQAGDHVADLGCGAGVECFIAARLAGPSGRVWGVDMLDPMLALAQQARPAVAANLGHDTVSFAKGLLEALPLEDASLDVVISNCVMNLSVNKRRAYAEIWRVLKPGGRLVIADVVCDSAPDPAIANDDVLRGQCIAGALTQAHLAGLLAESGFQGIRLLKRFAYRQVSGHRFYSLTFAAVKPSRAPAVTVIYRGPAPGLLLEDGKVLLAGIPAAIDGDSAQWLGDSVFVLDQAGNVTNLAAGTSCGCGIAPETAPIRASGSPALARQPSGCMVCGAPLTYLTTPTAQACTFCGRNLTATAVCAAGHFVCDACHGADAMGVIAHICLTTGETDMLRLLEQIRRHPAIPVHGPEHHAMAAGIILATYRNRGGAIGADQIRTGLDRGRTISGGACGFFGTCGAAVGVGIAFSIILEATPLTPNRRQAVQRVTAKALAAIAGFAAARCCQREMVVALKKAAVLSATTLPIGLSADATFACRQRSAATECIGPRCPLFRARPARPSQKVRPARRP